MAIVTEYRLNDEGIPFGITFIDENDGTVVDISTATITNIIFKKPGTTKITVSGVFTTDGVDGKIYHTWLTGELDEIGIWQAQGYVEMSPKKLSSSIITFRVFDNL